MTREEFYRNYPECKIIIPKSKLDKVLRKLSEFGVKMDFFERPPVALELMYSIAKERYIVSGILTKEQYAKSPYKELSVTELLG